MVRPTIWTLFVLFVVFSSTHGQLPRFANYIQDHMVLQRAPHRAIVWGFGQAGVKTTLTIGDKIYTTISETKVANDLGQSIWTITLDPSYNEGPFDIHVSQPLSNGTLYDITLRDVLFGDVWICSGQSNMQMAVRDIFNGSAEIANAGNYPKIRVFTAALRPSDTPLEELIAIEESWSVASPTSIGGPSFDYMSAVCWVYGRMIHEALGGRPIGLIATSWGGTAIELWMPPKALNACGIATDRKEQVPLQKYDDKSPDATLNHSDLYNAMIYPFTRTVIYGAIWYQGEANAGYNTDKYQCTFAQMIQSWRQTWYSRTNTDTDIEFPFGFVQLSTFTNNSALVGLFPVIRWHQTFDVGYVPNSIVPRVFMAVALDLRDDPNNIHPRTKIDVGYRLSRSGLAVAYNQSVEYQGPIVSSVNYTPGANSLTITYRAVENLDLRNPAGFDVCCSGSQCTNDNLWIPASISGKSQLTITVPFPKACQGQPIYGIRYLWRETPCPFKQAALYSSTDANLPSPPFLKIF